MFYAIKIGKFLGAYISSLLDKLYCRMAECDATIYLIKSVRQDPIMKTTMFRLVRIIKTYQPIERRTVHMNRSIIRSIFTAVMERIKFILLGLIYSCCRSMQYSV